MCSLDYVPSVYCTATIAAVTTASHSTNWKKDVWLFRNQTKDGFRFIFWSIFLFTGQIEWSKYWSERLIRATIEPSSTSLCVSSVIPSDTTPVVITRQLNILFYFFHISFRIYVYYSECSTWCGTSTEYAGIHTWNTAPNQIDFHVCVRTYSLAA